MLRKNNVVDNFNKHMQVYRVYSQNITRISLAWVPSKIQHHNIITWKWILITCTTFNTDGRHRSCELIKICHMHVIYTSELNWYKLQIMFYASALAADPTLPAELRCWLAATACSWCRRKSTPSRWDSIKAYIYAAIGTTTKIKKPAKPPTKPRMISAVVSPPADSSLASDVSFAVASMMMIHQQQQKTTELKIMQHMIVYLAGFQLHIRVFIITS